MRKLDREIIEIGEGASLHDLNDRLRELQDILPEDAEARVSVQGDDYFGWRIVVTYFRELTAEEADIQRRYANPVRRSKRFAAARLFSQGPEQFSI